MDYFPYKPITALICLISSSKASILFINSVNVLVGIVNVSVGVGTGVVGARIVGTGTAQIG